MDRRINRTRRALTDALITLMRLRTWDQINVQAICDQADISRSTFYTHFENKGELLDLCFAQLEAQLTAPRPMHGVQTNRTLAFLPNLLEHVSSHCDLFRRNVNSPGGQVIFNRFKSVVTTLTEQELQSSNQPALRTLSPDAITFINGGIFAMLEQWNRDDCRESTQDVERRIDRVIGSLMHSGNPVQIPGAGVGAPETGKELAKKGPQ